MHFAGVFTALVGIASFGVRASCQTLTQRAFAKGAVGRVGRNYRYAVARQVSLPATCVSALFTLNETRSRK